MKIGILQTGRSPEELRERHGDYDDLFRTLLAGQDFEFQTWAVLDGEFPDSVDDADGWLVTGSRFGVYEPHAWIPPLEEFLRKAYAGAVPIVGICFGHQVLAQALGGKVAKFDGGWSAGVERYQLEGFDDDAQVIAWHQDQVIEPPPQARVIGSTPFCRYAALAYDDKALSLQPHPEFNADFVTGLIEARRAVLPAGVAERAAASLPGELSTTRVASMIGEFFRKPRGHGEGCGLSMRYREGGPPGIADYGVTDDFLVATVVFTLFTGIVFVIAGRYGRQLWLVFWGALSVLVCSGYLVLMAMNII